VKDFAIVLTHNRPELLMETVAAIGPQVQCVVVIDNASEPPIALTDFPTLGAEGYRLVLLTVPDQPPNLSALWNRGFDAVQQLREFAMIAGEYEQATIAVLCDDAPPPPGWFAAVRAGLVDEQGSTTGHAVACTSPWGSGESTVKLAPDGDLYRRMPGWAWAINPDSGVRADESLRWWWNDTDIDWQARAHGGMAMVPGPAVPNHRPNDFTATRPELGAQCGLDRMTFEAKWGAPCPW
jgi:hypothetical protein